jgi:thiosulfate reductase cytochrome b subunit
MLLLILVHWLFCADSSQDIDVLHSTVDTPGVTRRTDAGRRHRGGALDLSGQDMYSNPPVTVLRYPPLLLANSVARLVGQWKWTAFDFSVQVILLVFFI